MVLWEHYINSMYFTIDPGCGVTSTAMSQSRAIERELWVEITPKE
ncbi:MAG TPA: hypothetical protein VNL13_04410 [Sulfolobales archaeon]|nr:hypothetical protein [Sulfolobales archaeon]